MAKAISFDLESDEHQVSLQSQGSKVNPWRQRSGGNGGLEKEVSDETRLVPTCIHEAPCCPVWSWLIFKSPFLLAH